MSDVQQLGAEALKGMSPEAIVAALRAGQFRDYLAGDEVTAAAPVPEAEQHGSAWTAGKDPAEIHAALKAGRLRAYLAGEIE